MPWSTCFDAMQEPSEKEIVLLEQVNLDTKIYKAKFTYYFQELET